MEWQKKTEQEIMEKLKTNRNGLKQEEANERIKKYGLNELPKAKKDNIFKIFFSEFNDPIIWLLIVSIIFSFIVGEVVDACAIIFIILIDAIVGTIQEWKASKSAEALQDLIKVQVKVWFFWITIKEFRELEYDDDFEFCRNEAIELYHKIVNPYGKI